MNKRIGSKLIALALAACMVVPMLPNRANAAGTTHLEISISDDRNTTVKDTTSKYLTENAPILPEIAQIVNENRSILSRTFPSPAMLKVMDEGLNKVKMGQKIWSEYKLKYRKNFGGNSGLKEILENLNAKIGDLAVDKVYTCTFHNDEKHDPHYGRTYTVTIIRRGEPSENWHETIENLDGVVTDITTTPDGKVTAQIKVPDGVSGSKVLVLKQDAKPGDVPVIIYDDGTEEIVRKSFPTPTGVIFKVDDDLNVKIIDNSKDFDDVKGHWGADAIDFVTARELFSGTAPRIFAPNVNMTRGMLATVIHNLESNPPVTYAGKFDDVKNGKWYTNGVEWGAEAGVVAGYGNGMFGPNDTITREQLAMMLYNYAGHPEVKNRELTFKDKDMVSGWAEEAVYWAVENGIINGVGNNMLAPRELATRAQVAAMLYSYMKYQLVG